MVTSSLVRGAPGREDRPAPRGVDGETGTASQLVCQGGSSEQGEQGKLVRVKQWAALHIR